MILNDISPIKAVKGLDESELETLNKLQETWWRKRPRNLLRNRYYDAHNVLKDLGISIPPSLKRIETYVGWPAKAVDYLADRTVLEGFTFDGIDSNDIMDEVMEANDFVSMYSQAVTDALISSFSLIAVTKGAEGEPNALVTAHSARDGAALWDFRRNRIGCGIVVADVRRDESGAIVGPSLINMFTGDEVIVLGWRRNGHWVLEDRQKHSQGQPLIEAIRYAPKLGRPMGRSRISRPVMAITDSAVREALRSEVSAEFFTAPQKYILGADEDLFDGKPRWEAYIGCYMAITTNGEGEKPEVGQLPQGSIQPHVDYERQLAAKLSGETSIPISSLGVIHDNPSSAEAIYAAKEDIVIKAQNFNRDNASALRRIGRLMFAVSEGMSVSELPPEIASMAPRFMNPAIPSIASQTDAVVKQVSAVPGFANTRVFWEQLGYDDAQIARIQSDMERAATKQRIAELMAPSQKEDPETPLAQDGGGIAEPAEIQGKALNGAQTQSLIAIMSQYSGGVITEGQAINLIATSIGVSKADARDLLNGKVD